MAQKVNNLLAMRHTWVQTVGRKISLEKGMAPHYSILAGRVPWSEEPEGYNPGGRKELDMTEQLTLSIGYKLCDILNSEKMNVYTQREHVL